MINYYIIGILWGTSRLNDECMFVQNVDKSIIEEVKEAIASKKKVFYVNEHNQKTWRLKLARSHPYVQWMIDNGFSGKSDRERSIPDLSGDALMQFFQGYFVQHYTLDEKQGHPRLRFYASRPIVDKLNSFLNRKIGSSIKKLQRHGKSNVTYILYMQSKEEVNNAVNILQINN